jgi:hypothetical protein
MSLGTGCESHPLNCCSTFCIGSTPPPKRTLHAPPPPPPGHISAQHPQAGLCPTSTTSHCLDVAVLWAFCPACSLVSV